VTAPLTSAITSRGSILRDPKFGRLWFIQASTQVGGNMALYALTVLVFSSTRSNAAVSALVMSFLVPTIALSAIAGVVVDRLDLRVALVGPNIVRAALTFGLAAAGANVPALLILNLGISLTTVMLTPAEGAMIPRIVARDQLEAAMGIFNLTLQASFGVGFAFLGPLLVNVAGPSTVLAVVTVLYIAATLACAGLPASPPAPIAPGLASRALHEPFRQLREGFAAIHGNRDVARPLLHLAAAASLVGIIGVLGPSLATSIGLEPKQLIVIVLPLGLGVVGGVFGLRRFGRGVSRRRAAESGLVTFGILAFGVAVAGPLGNASGLGPVALPILGEVEPLLPVIIVLAFCAGAAYAATTVSAQTALFENMPEQVRGRVFGVLASIVSAASLLPILVAGPLADAVSPQAVITVVALGVIATALASAWFFGTKPGGRTA
jgi:MFS family permease